MRSLFFNGKFYAASLNGVHRVADRLIREVDRLLVAMPSTARPAATLLAPTGATWLPELAAIKIVQRDGARSQLWEQIALPQLARNGVLVNLCNLAPIAHSRKILLLHDAQFLFPDSSYPARQRLGYRWLTPRMARSSSQVLTVSEYSRQILDLTGVAPAARTAVLSNGADHMLEVPATIGLLADLGLVSGRYVMMFGSTKRYKNVRVVFEAFEDHRLADLRLVIVGPDRATLENAGLRPPAQAVFAGRVGDGELRALYSEALCVAFPSRTEGFGLPPIEAAFCDCPAIVSPAGAIPEVCRDAVLYAGVDDSQEWVEAILGYATDTTLRADKQHAARLRAEAFRWSSAGEQLLEHILRLAAS